MKKTTSAQTLRFLNNVLMQNKDGDPNDSAFLKLKEKKHLCSFLQTITGAHVQNP